MINKHWTRIVSKWYEKNGLEFNIVLPHVTPIYHAGGYLTKYMTKEDNEIKGNMYGISQSARELFRPAIERTFRVDASKVNDVLFEALSNLNTDITRFAYKDFNGNIGAWLHNDGSLLFNINEAIQSIENE